MSITKAQVIDTVLMRYGNRQGNTALQTQALIEWDLLFDELYDMPRLPSFLKDSFIATFVYTYPSQILTYANNPSTHRFDRFVEADNVPPPFVVLSTSDGVTTTPVYKKLRPLSADEYLEKLEEENGVPLRGDLTHYYVETGVQGLDTGEIYRGQIVHFWPASELTETIYMNGYSLSKDAWLSSAPQLIISGLGMRMGPYVKDAEELGRFQQDFYRQLQMIFNRDVAMEQDAKYGNRGDN